MPLNESTTLDLHAPTGTHVKYFLLEEIDVATYTLVAENFFLFSPFFSRITRTFFPLLLTLLTDDCVPTHCRNLSSLFSTIVKSPLGLIIVSIPDIEISSVT